MFLNSQKNPCVPRSLITQQMGHVWVNVDALSFMRLHHLAVHADQTQAPRSHQSAAKDRIQ